MFSTNYQEVNDIIPAGVYEAMITSAKEDGKITIGLEIRKDVDEMKAAGIPITVCVADSLTDEAEREEWKALALETFAGEEIRYDPLTCSIGCHAGPGAFGMGVCRRAL